MVSQGVKTVGRDPKELRRKNKATQGQKSISGRGNSRGEGLEVEVRERVAFSERMREGLRKTPWLCQEGPGRGDEVERPTGLPASPGL